MDSQASGEDDSKWLNAPKSAPKDKKRVLGMSRTLHWPWVTCRGRPEWWRGTRRIGGEEGRLISGVSAANTQLSHGTMEEPVMRAIYKVWAGWREMKRQVVVPRAGDSKRRWPSLDLKRGNGHQDLERGNAGRPLWWGLLLSAKTQPTQGPPTSLFCHNLNSCQGLPLVKPNRTQKARDPLDLAPVVNLSGHEEK